MRKFIIFLSVLLCFAKSVYSYDDKKTHRDITEKAVDASSLGVYLKNNLGLQEGVSSLINNKTVTWWLREGAYLEDSPMCRASNHFHNPLLPWDQSYMSDEPWWIATYCGATGYSTKYSSVTWGTGYLSPASSGTKTSISSQEWGWDDTRNYYYLALTSSANTDRETYFSTTFQALGQVLHLIEDGAQPAHVRNDFRSHLTFIGFESMIPTQWFGSQFEHYVKNHPELVTSEGVEIPSFTRVTDFWDTDQYNGSNPSTSLSFGIIEFTNANYFSDETIPNNNPTPEHTFPYPQVNSTNTQICEDYAPDSTDIRKYISRNVGNPCPSIVSGGNVDHFATPSLLNEESVITNNNISNLKLWLDDNVHNTYAKELLPSAVGYSAGLLNYFFRGQMNMDKDPNNGSQYVIKNESSEYMSGTFTLYYDDTTDNRRYLTSWNKSINPNSTSDSVSFTEPTDMKEKGKYILVFQGTLGNETGAVVGRVVELKGGIGRVVGVSGNSITVYMEDGGTISGSLPPLPSGMSRSRAISVRFDKNDWNIFAVLTIYCDDPDCRNGYYAFHKYSINSDKTLSYHGVVLTKEVFPSVELTQTSTKKEGGNYQYDYHEFWTLITKVSHFTCVDFFLNGSIKPFGVINEIEVVGKIEYQFTEIHDQYGNWTGEWSKDTMWSRIDKDKRSAELYYGGIIAEITIRDCGNNYSLCTGVILENISGGSVKYAQMYVPGYIYPLAIFNEIDYAYIRYYDLYSVRREERWPPGYWLPWNYNGIYLPWTVDPIISPLPITNSLRLPSNSYIRTILRDENKYSFFQRMDGCGGLSYAPTLAEKVTKCPGVIKAGGFDPYDLNITLDEAVSYIILDRGTYWDANKSYSSETGAMNCQNVLILNNISDNEGYYLASKNGSFVKFKSCSDWKPLEGGGSGYIFDVTLKQ